MDNKFHYFILKGTVKVFLTKGSLFANHVKKCNESRLAPISTYLHTMVFVLRGQINTYVTRF